MRRPVFALVALLASVLLFVRCTGEVLDIEGADAAQPPSDAAPTLGDAQASADAAGLDADQLPGRDVGSAGVDAAAGADASAAPGDAGPSSSRQTARPLGSTTAPNGFHEYLPPGYDDGQPRALLVFWHGVGEDGNGTTDLGKVLSNGPPMLVAHDAWPASRPFVVLSPQHGPSNCPSAGEVDAFLTWAMADYRIDPRRVYLTGLSCGAIGAWSYLGQYRAKVVAAAVLIAGDPGDPTQAWSAWGKSGCGLGELALWAFHGDKDPTVPYGNENATMADLLACPSPPRRDAKWTVIPNGGHVVWGPIYDGTGGDDIYAFMLAHPKP